MIVSVVLDNKRKQDLAATQLHNMTEMIVLVKRDKYRTVSCQIALVASTTQHGPVGVCAVCRVELVSRQKQGFV